MRRPAFDPATDYYQLLGVTPGASVDEIQAAYRRLAKVFHPDLHAGSSIAAARMARLNVAKSVLLDHEARAKYDQQRALRRRVVAPVGAAHPARTAPTAPRPTHRAATTYTTTTRVAPGKSGLDRTTGLLLLVVVPLVGALLLYVGQAVQMAGQPVRSSPADLALSPGGRPNARGTADAVYLMVRNSVPSRRVALDAHTLILSRNDETPEGESLRAVDRQLLQAAAASDATAWHAAVAEVCVLASRC